MTGKRRNAGQNLQKEVAALQRKLASCNLNRNAGSNRRRRRRGNGNAGGGSVPAAMGSSPNPNGGRGRRRARSSAVGNGGRILLSRDELLLTVSTSAGKEESVLSKDLIPSSGVMPFLHRLSSCYQRIRWLRAHITWRPSCGTSTNGIISYGVAYNGSQSATTRELVTSLTPCNDHPVWQSTGVTPLVVPPEMLMSRKWYALNVKDTDAFDTAMGKFCVGLSHDSEPSAKSRGEFWISYSVEMEGTNPG